MSTKRDRVHAGGFIISEEVSRSRANGFLAEGENLDAGTLLELNDDGDLVAWSAGGNPVAGILFGGADASSARCLVAYVACAAVVSLDGLTFPDGFDTTVANELQELHIVVLSDAAIPADTGGGGGGYATFDSTSVSFDSTEHKFDEAA